jgi:predicted O-methyltransferase YrrM
MEPGVMVDWYSFRHSLRVQNEADNHPHSQHELAHLFTSVQFEDTEIDFLDLLYGIVRAKKPQNVLETGTHLGLSATALGFALKDNGIYQSPPPHLYTVEKKPELAVTAQKRFVDIGLDSFVSVHNYDSLDFIQTVYSGPPFEVVFFDSSRSIRPEEYYQLRRRNLLSPGSLLLFHDTSERRAETLSEQKESQDAYLFSLKRITAECSGCIRFDLSRGLVILQWGS